VSALPFSSPREAFVIAAPSQACDCCTRAALSLTPRGDSWLCPGCRSQQPSGLHEAAARVRKVFALAMEMRDVTPEIFNQMGDREWSLVARRVGVGLPSIETRVLVAQALEDAARRREESHAA
jgi:hypothetical protein